MYPSGGCSMRPDDYLQYLLIIDGVHRRVYDTFRFLEGLHDRFPQLFPASPSESQSYHRLLLHYQIIELVCQYIELLGSYSVACGETGLLYPHRILSIGTGEAVRFYDRVASLTDDHIRRIFNPRRCLTDAEVQDIRDRYTRIANFYAQNRSLYNAIKHGSRVYPMGIEPTATATDEMGPSYIAFQWVHVHQGRRRQYQVAAHTWDGIAVNLSIRDQEIRTELFPADDLSAYRAIINDCHFIIERILANNATERQSRLSND